MTTLVYRGNFNVDFSTESHVAASLESLGHTVIRHQEDEIPWPATVKACRDPADLFLWTSTFSMAHVWDQRQAHAAVHHLNTLLPTAAFHLDKFMDLPRESQIVSEPWFKLSHVFTADGGQQDRWEGFGVNHHWLPPAVYGAECYLGSPRPEYTSDIAFVGSWRGHYHPESRHRRDLINYLRRRFRGKVRFWPHGPAIRGKDLNDLYASTKIVVGDSCMVGDAKRGHYWSDRIPETTGRGGFLLHPSIPGLDDIHPDLVTWQADQWSALGSLINLYLGDSEARERLQLMNHEHTRTNHTYAHRMEELLRVVLKEPHGPTTDGADDRSDAEREVGAQAP